jgi:hypothetical protein
MNPVRISGLFLVSMLAGALTTSLPSRPSRAAATIAPAVDDDGITCLEYCQSEEALCRGACKDDAACACACGTGPRSCSSICGVPNPDPPDGCDGPGPGSATVAQTDFPCQFAPDGSVTLECHEQGECYRDECHNQTCTRIFQPGGRCEDDGTCQADGSCKKDLDSACRDACFQQFQLCQGDCFTDPACPCRCRNEHERCRSFCDGEEPVPPEFCGDPLQR